ncbi:hypothetical protein ISCGN_027254 [Ixodes scapularis]
MPFSPDTGSPRTARRGWDLATFYSGSVVSPMWLGSVVTLLTKHLAPKVQAPPAGLGVRGDATLQTPAFTGAPCGGFAMITQHVLEGKIHLLVRRCRGGTLKTAETPVPSCLFTSTTLLENSINLRGKTE